MPRQPDGSAARVLVADDDAGIRRSVKRILERAGHDVIVAVDGEEALERLTDTHCDILLSDLQMPRRSGMELVRSVRERELDIPIVLMTGGETETRLAVEALERGVSSYLRKPFTPHAVKSAISNALSRHRKIDATTRALVEREHALSRLLSTLYVHRQPIVHWPTRTVLGFECLLRGNEPALPHPGAVLEAAELHGRLHELGRAVRSRCTEGAGAGEAPPTIFVNLHPLDLLDEDLYSPDAPLASIAERVVLEITERARLDEVGRARESVMRLRELGYRVAIDDIGAGFAGLSSLASFSPDIVKIDMSLVRDVDQSRVKRHLVDALVKICDDYGMAVIAEGVETPAELGALLELGCELFQGYLFAKPGPGFPEPEWDVLC